MVSIIYISYYVIETVRLTVSELSHITVFFDHLCKINY